MSSGPPSLFPQRRNDVLKSFSDILNLPFSLGGGKEQEVGGEAEAKEEVNEEEEDQEATVDFPFCFQCTNKKVLLLTMVHQKLQILQEQFDHLKDNIIKDILRVFVTNMVVEKKLPVEAIREARICGRMYHCKSIFLVFVA